MGTGIAILLSPVEKNEKYRQNQIINPVDHVISTIHSQSRGVYLR
jgi:hypothetical protein